MCTKITKNRKITLVTIYISISFKQIKQLLLLLSKNGKCYFCLANQAIAAFAKQSRHLLQNKGCHPPGPHPTSSVPIITISSSQDARSYY